MNRIPRTAVRKWRRAIFALIFGCAGIVVLSIVAGTALAPQLSERTVGIVMIAFAAAYIAWLVGGLIMMQRRKKECACPHCGAGKKLFDTVDVYMPYQNALFKAANAGSFVCPVCGHTIEID